MDRAAEEHTGGTSLPVPADEPGFVRWAAASACELAYFAQMYIEGVDDMARASADGEGTLSREEAVSFLTSGEMLADLGGCGVPGYYELAVDRRLAAENMLYVLYGNAWREIDGVDCDLRLYTDCDPEEDQGTVIALDATGREGCPAGTVIFLLDPVSLESFVSRNERELYRLYLAVRDGRTPSPAS